MPLVLVLTAAHHLLAIHACGMVSTCGHTAGPSLARHSSLQGRQLPRGDLGRTRRPMWAALALPGFQGCTAALGVAAHLSQELSYLLSSSLLSSLSQNLRSSLATCLYPQALECTALRLQPGSVGNPPPQLLPWAPLWPPFRSSFLEFRV